MLKRLLKRAASPLLILAVATSLCALILEGHMRTYTIPTAETLGSPMNVSAGYSAPERRAIEKSRLSAVRILAWTENSSSLSVSSGTYFHHRGKYFVLTVQHGLFVPSCSLIQIEVGGSLYPCTAVLSYDMHADYAILEVDQIVDRKPLRFPRDFVRHYRDWRRATAALTPLIYTGYPNTIGPVTLEGRVMGLSGDEFVYLNSYAWSGSSGSGVFDLNGRLVGYIVAIDVGHTEYGYDVLENVILVVPNYKIDWSILFK